MTMTEWHRRASYCDPDNFNMYIYNEWRAWGLNELHENLVSWLRLRYSAWLTRYQLVSFHDEFRKKRKSIEAMWTAIPGMLH